jgi:hypothetical protein
MTNAMQGQFNNLPTNTQMPAPQGLNLGFNLPLNAILSQNQILPNNNNLNNFNANNQAFMRNNNNFNNISSNNLASLSNQPNNNINPIISLSTNIASSLNVMSPNGQTGININNSISNNNQNSFNSPANVSKIFPAICNFKIILAYFTLTTVVKGNPTSPPTEDGKTKKFQITGVILERIQNLLFTISQSSEIERIAYEKYKNVDRKSAANNFNTNKLLIRRR